MKRFLVVLLVCGLLLGGSAVAAEAPTFEGLPVVRVVVDGEELKTDVPAVFLAGRTMVPLRAVSDALGADVRWDEGSRTVSVSAAANLHALPDSEMALVMEYVDALLVWQLAVGHEDPEWREKNLAVIAIVDDMMSDLEGISPSSNWTTAYHAGVLGMAYYRAAVDAMLASFGASNSNDVRQLASTSTWLSGQATAQHDILHAEFTRLTGREPDHELPWKDD